MTLTQLFTDIANAIRSKIGSSEKIKPTDFASNINSIITTPQHAIGEHAGSGGTVNFTIDVGGTNKHTSIIYTVWGHHGYSFTCYFRCSNDNTNWTTLKSGNFPTNYSRRASDSVLEWTFAAHNQQWRYYNIYIPDGNHGLYGSFIAATYN